MVCIRRRQEGIQALVAFHGFRDAFLVQRADAGLAGLGLGERLAGFGQEAFPVRIHQPQCIITIRRFEGCPGI